MFLSKDLSEMYLTRHRLGIILQRIQQRRHSIVVISRQIDVDVSQAPHDLSKQVVVDLRQLCDSVVSYKISKLFCFAWDTPVSPRAPGSR